MATQPQLHWFWRAMIGALLGAICFGFSYSLLASLAHGALYWLYALGVPKAIAFRLIYVLPGLPASIVALSVYGLLTRQLGRPISDGELHCRRCNHTLRGLSEPRCPECGEPI